MMHDPLERNEKKSLCDKIGLSDDHAKDDAEERCINVPPAFSCLDQSIIYLERGKNLLLSFLGRALSERKIKL